MSERSDRQQNEDEQALERERLGGPADYDEAGGTGLEPREGDAVIGGGVSGSDEDPIGEPGIPDEALPGRRPDSVPDRTNGPAEDQA